MHRVIVALCLATVSAHAAADQEARATATPDRPCVAVALPAVTVPDDVDASALSATLQAALVDALGAEGAAAQALAADGLGPEDAAACATRVTTRLVVKHKGGSSWLRRALIDATSAAVSQVPVTSAAEAAAMAAAGSGTQALAGMAATSQARDEVRFTYGAAASGRTLLRDTRADARVTSNGQDVFTPLVANAAKAIVAALATRPRGER